MCGVCVCVCVCKRQRQTETDREKGHTHTHTHTHRRERMIIGELSACPQVTNSFGSEEPYLAVFAWRTRVTVCLVLQHHGDEVEGAPLNGFAQSRNVDGDGLEREHEILSQPRLDQHVWGEEEEVEEENRETRREKKIAGVRSRRGGEWLVGK